MVQTVNVKDEDYDEEEFKNIKIDIKAESNIESSNDDSIPAIESGFPL